MSATATQTGPVSNEDAQRAIMGDTPDRASFPIRFCRREILRAMQEYAAPVMRHYSNDLNLADAGVIAGLQPDDVILWAPCECGTRLIVLARADKPNVRAKEHFDAVLASGAPPVWYLGGVSVDKFGEHHPSLLATSGAYDTAAIVARWHERAIAPGAQTVSELHL